MSTGRTDLSGGEADPVSRATRARETEGASGAPAPAIRITNLSKTFVRANGTVVTPVDDVTLEVDLDDLVVLLGPSGCGKTTLLRCVAGLERPDSGEIEIDGKVVFSSDRKIFLPPERRGINMIFQSYALWPHMTVLENVMFPLKSKRVAKAERVERAREALDIVGLAEVGNQHPGRISGGQQQRVALARAIVGRDRVILFDEPLSNVDAAVRAKLRVELLDIKRKLGFSALYVTHDQSEAMELADRIAVLSEGKVCQYDDPRVVYQDPATEYVGSFVGSTNTLAGTLDGPVGHEHPVVVKVDSELGPITATVRRPLARTDGQQSVRLVSRPESWSLAVAPVPGRNAWQGTVEAVLFGGAQTEYRVAVGNRAIRVLSSDSVAAKIGDEVWVSVAADAVLVLVPDSASP